MRDLVRYFIIMIMLCTCPTADTEEVSVFDQIFLKGGKRITGFKVSETETSVIIQKDGAELQIPKSQIEKIIEKTTSSAAEKQGDIMFSEKDYDRAVEYYQRALTETGDEVASSRLENKIRHSQTMIERKFKERFEREMNSAERQAANHEYDSAINTLTTILNDPVMTDQTEKIVRAEIARILCMKARSYIDQVQSSRALLILQKAIETAPHYYESYILKGDVLLQQAEATSDTAQVFSAGIDLGSKELEKQGELIAYYRKTGDLYQENGLPKQAINFYLKIIESGKEDQEIIDRTVEAFEELAKSFSLQDEKSIQETVEGLQRAIQLNPERFEARRILADIFIKVKKYNDAIAQLEKMKILRPTEKGTNFRLGLSYFGKGDLEAAEQALLQEIQIDPDNYESYYRLGKIYLEWKKYTEAVKKARKTLDIAPDYARAREIIAEAYYRNEQFDSAKIWYQRILENKKADQDIGLQAQLRLAQIELRQENYDEANRKFTSIMDIFAQSQDSDDPKDLVEKLSESQKEVYADCLTNQGTIMLRVQSSPRSALELHKEALLFNPQFAMAYNNMGLAYIEMDEHDQAEKMMIEARELNPENPDYWLSLGTLYEKVKQAEEAIRHYKEYILRGGREWEKVRRWLLDLNVPEDEIPEPKFKIEIIEELVEEEEKPVIRSTPAEARQPQEQRRNRMQQNFFGPNQGSEIGGPFSPRRKRGQPRKEPGRDNRGRPSFGR